MELPPHQQAAVSWFLGLSPRRGLIALPPGSGKSSVALGIVKSLAHEDPALVIVPVRILAGQWAERARSSGLTALALDARTASRLVAERNGATPRTDVWVTTLGTMSESSVGEVVKHMPWSIVIVDEAHKPAGDALDFVGQAPAILVLTATANGATGPLGVLPEYVSAAVAASPVHHRVIEVRPMPGEQAYLEAIAAWVGHARSNRVDQFRRAIVARVSAAGVLLGIDALERILAGNMSDVISDEPVIPELAKVEFKEPRKRLDEQARLEIEHVLTLAYGIELPDSRTVRLVQEMLREDPSRLIVVSSLVSNIGYLADLLRASDVPTVVITGAMDANERGNALARARTSGSALLLSDATVGPGTTDGRTALVHGDIPSEDRESARISLLLEDPIAWNQGVTSTIVRWPGPPPSHAASGA